MKRILVIGSANMDLSLNVYRMPERGETLTDNGGVAYTPGGKGANAGVALRRLGAEVFFMAKLGMDMHGQALYDFYKKEGIDTSTILVDRVEPTGFATVIKENGGHNRIIYYPGANEKMTREEMARAFDKAKPDALYIGFEISFASALEAASLAEERGVPIFVDAAPADKSFKLEALPPLEIFSPNESETFEYTGIRPDGQEASLRASLALWRRVRARYIVIKLGERGASIYDGKHFYMVAASPVSEVVDTTAAGDTFTSAMTLKYLLTGDIRAAVKYGTQAAALTISRWGATASVPTALEVEEYISSLN